MTRTTGEVVIEVFNNWFLKEHGMLPEQAIDRIKELEAQLTAQRQDREAMKTAWNDEMNELRARLERVRDLPDQWRLAVDQGLTLPAKDCADELEEELEQKTDLDQHLPRYLADPMPPDSI